jgi:Rps23 Pro-64 3,4-dihydroxylase Tpa1-like proline 4-hydroxylase
MEFIDFGNLEQRTGELKDAYQSAKPFHYLVFEDFFKPAAARQIHDHFPAISDGQWDGTTYIDQKNKFQKNKFDAGDIFHRVFAELNCAQFLGWLGKITQVDDLIADDELFGGGLHQSINGAFLNVHVDYNIHPTTKYHRRLNVLVYMNADWKEEYGGHLELWEISENKKELLQKIAPTFNRCVIFETNERSFHGHPQPLKTPGNVNRKSLATYYYTAQRPQSEIAGEHNTIYVNTQGITGLFRRLRSGMKAAFERLYK